MTGQWFSMGTPISSTNKTDCQDITEILLKVVLNIINLKKKQIFLYLLSAKICDEINTRKSSALNTIKCFMSVTQEIVNYT